MSLLTSSPAASPGSAQDRTLELQASRDWERLCHDLRSPLQTILGYAGLLREGKRGVLNETQERYVAQIEAAVDRALAQLRADALPIAEVRTPDGEQN